MILRSTVNARKQPGTGRFAVSTLHDANRDPRSETSEEALDVLAVEEVRLGGVQPVHGSMVAGQKRIERVLPIKLDVVPFARDSFLDRKSTRLNSSHVA